VQAVKGKKVDTKEEFEDEWYYRSMVSGGGVLCGWSEFILWSEAFVWVSAEIGAVHGV
jgi:hypothetical protein